MGSLKMLLGTGNPHTSCIILGNAVNTRYPMNAKRKTLHLPKVLSFVLSA